MQIQHATYSSVLKTPQAASDVRFGKKKKTGQAAETTPAPASESKQGILQTLWNLVVSPFKRIPFLNREQAPTSVQEAPTVSIEVKQESATPVVASYLQEMTAWPEQVGQQVPADMMTDLKKVMKPFKYSLSFYEPYGPSESSLRRTVLEGADAQTDYSGSVSKSAFGPPQYVLQLQNPSTGHQVSLRLDEAGTIITARDNQANRQGDLIQPLRYFLQGVQGLLQPTGAKKVRKALVGM